MKLTVKITTPTTEEKYLDALKKDLINHGFDCTWQHYRRGIYIPGHPESQENGSEFLLTRHVRGPKGLFYWLLFVDALAHITLDSPKVEILE